MVIFHSYVSLPEGSFTMSTVAQNKPSKQSMTGGPKQLVGISESSLSWHGGWSKSTIAASTMTFPSFKVHDSTPQPSDPSLKTSGLSHQESTVNQPSLITTSPIYRWPVVYSSWSFRISSDCHIIFVPNKSQPAIASRFTVVACHPGEDCYNIRFVKAYEFGVIQSHLLGIRVCTSKTILDHYLLFVVEQCWTSNTFETTNQLSFGDIPMFRAAPNTHNWWKLGKSSWLRFTKKVTGSNPDHHQKFNHLLQCVAS